MRIVLAAHGMLAQEIVNSANMVFGKIDDLDIVTFLPGENVETLKNKYQEIIKKCDRDTEILFLVDLFGGSPYNAAFETVIHETRMEVITGLCLPMLIDVVGIREMNAEMKATEVFRNLKIETYTKSCKELLNKSTNKNNDDEEDEL